MPHFKAPAKMVYRRKRFIVYNITQHVLYKKSFKRKPRIALGLVRQRQATPSLSVSCSPTWYIPRYWAPNLCSPSFFRHDIPRPFSHSRLLFFWLYIEYIANRLRTCCGLTPIWLLTLLIYYWHKEAVRLLPQQFGLNKYSWVGLSGLCSLKLEPGKPSWKRKQIMWTASPTECKFIY